MGKVDTIKNIVSQHTNNKIEYDIGYCRYFGCGHCLYIFLKEYNEEVATIGDQRIHPKLMVDQISKLTSDFKIVRLSDMGDISVYGP